MSDVAQAIIELRPGAKWSVDGNTYDGITWLDTEQSKPTEAEINAKLKELEARIPLRLLREERNRRLAETDWWVMPDRVPTQDQLDYRQELRDITKTYTSLEDVVWPMRLE